MLKIINEVGFDILYRNAWGQAVAILDEISHADKEEALMDFLENLYPDGVDCVELNDILSYDWEGAYSQIGMPSEVTERLADEENEDVE